MMTKNFLAIALLALLVGAAFPVLASEALVKPIPSPDLSRLPASQAEGLRTFRATFEKTRATLLGPPLAEAYALMGAGYARAGFYDAAAIAMYDAAALAPEDGRWVYVQGIIARAQNQHAEAGGYFERAFALDQNYLPIRLAAAEVRLDQGDLGNAHKLVGDYLAKHQDQPAAYEMAGRIALRQKHYAEAVDQFNRALKLDPKASRVYAELAEAYTASGNAGAAATARSKAGPVAPTLLDPLGAGVLNATVTASSPSGRPADPVADKVALATLHLGAHEYAQAGQALDAALQLKPNDPVLLAFHARVAAASGNLTEATRRARASVAAGPDNALAQFTLGLVLEMSKDDSGARAAYGRSIAADPKLADARLALGDLLMRSGKYADAAAQYRQLTVIEPDKGDGWAKMVAADVAAGHCAVALKQIGDGLAKRPDYGFLMQLFMRIVGTCPAASAEEKRRALEDGGKLYRASHRPQVGEAYALALAVNGRWDDAVKTQAAAMFVQARDRRQAAVNASREFLKQFEAHRLPDRPWPPSSPLYHPQRPAPDPKPVAGAAKTPGK